MLDPSEAAVALEQVSCQVDRTQRRDVRLEIVKLKDLKRIRLILIKLEQAQGWDVPQINQYQAVNNQVGTGWHVWPMCAVYIFLR